MPTEACNKSVHGDSDHTTQIFMESTEDERKAVHVTRKKTSGRTMSKTNHGFEQATRHNGSRETWSTGVEQLRMPDHVSHEKKKT